MGEAKQRRQRALVEADKAFRQPDGWIAREGLAESYLRGYTRRRNRLAYALVAIGLLVAATTLLVLAVRW